jgi:hypothetical protein
MARNNFLNMPIRFYGVEGSAYPKIIQLCPMNFNIQKISIIAINE